MTAVVPFWEYHCLT